MWTRLASVVAPVGGVRAATKRLPHPPLAELGRGAAQRLTDEELAAVFCRMVALPAGTVPGPIVLHADVPDRALTAAFRAPAQRWQPSTCTPRSIGPRSGASPSRGSSSPPAARQTRAAAWLSPRGRGRFSSPQPTVGHLARFALMVTGPDLADDADRLAR